MSSRGFTRNESCIMRILRDHGELATSEILDLAKSKKYSEICADCEGGDVFVVASNHLKERGLITRTFGKGGYHWELVNRE